MVDALAAPISADTAQRERAKNIAQLAEDACASADPIEITRSCAALRDAVLAQCQQGSVSAEEARVLCQIVDEAQVRAIEDSAHPRAPQAPMLEGALQTIESLIEASPLPIVSLDRRGTVQIWNHAAEEMFGWLADEVIGRPPPLIPPEMAEEAQHLEEIALAGNILQGREVRRMRKDKSPIDLTLSMAPLPDARGQVVGTISIVADISDRKRREALAEETARFRDHFVGIVGHDLRNPLTAILTSAQLLLRYGNLDARQSRVVTRVFASAERMARMIDDLLDFARTRLGGGFPINPRRIDLRELTEHTVEELLFAYPGRDVRVEADGDLWGNWDPDRMEQVISNLVGNALQHSTEGEVRVTLRGERDVVVLETHNGGAPIPPEVLPHVFEPGRRGDARAGGVGLGLYIVQQIIVAHRGSIEARSEPNDGTTFVAVLPRKSREKV